MTVDNVPGKDRAVTAARAGARALSLLAVPLNAALLQELAKGPSSLTELRRNTGSPPPTTMRGHLRTLIEAGVLERRRRSSFPGSVDFALTSAGDEFLGVVTALQTWLDHAPEGSLELGTTAARSAIKALVDGWSTGILRVLAARPLSLTELDQVIKGVSYPSLERRLSAMRLVGQIEQVLGRERGTPYGVTPWLRYAVVPLGAATRWERLSGLPGASPVAPLDVEAALLLAVPLLRLPADLDGTCRLAVEVKTGNGGRQAGVLATIDQGRVVGCVTRIQGHAEAWVAGPPTTWLRAVIGGKAAGLEIGGDCRLALALVEGLHSTLVPRRSPTS